MNNKIEGRECTINAPKILQNPVPPSKTSNEKIRRNTDKIKPAILGNHKMKFAFSFFTVVYGTFT
jgi:hypothetical protein